MSRESDKEADRLVIGGPARANLLPPEVGAAAEGRALRRKAIALIVVAVLIAIAAYAGATVLALASQAQLTAANERTSALLQEQAKYVEVRQVTSMLDAAAAAQRVGTSTEIDWKKYLDEIQGSLPAGTLVINFRAETSTPLMDFGQPSVPLQGARMGELSFTATSQTLPDVESWLIGLSKLPGYVDASPGSITLDQEKSIYLVSITMHINKDALLLRYDEKAKAIQDKAREERDAAREKEEKAKADEAAKQNSSGTGSDSGTDSGTDKSGGE